ncbi:type IV secretion system DNA-binding domain-containing protein [Agrobacterium vitis]|uniref:type IV secretory system conjugative DNA transfer family protein n=1 Tax=Agrobacterium vitis TaxID=373 RepID=UPI0012E94A41|nr:type IV secretory system conjugative DNA transfer family protein [Agrobacterium vitis]MVA12946.1 type IV secretion system DNA-binding domain-containing protein [Agrobacterium vitis]
MTKGFKAVYLAFCLAVAFAAWMLGYGAGLHLFYGDGRILDTTIRSNPFAPIQQFWAYSDNPTLQKVALGSLVPAFLIAAITAYLGLRPVTSPLGDAAFQDIAGLRTGKWFGKKGHILGRFGGKVLRAQDDRHHLIIGPTRSGKGAGYVIPNALMHEGSMIVTDLKGEVFKATAGYRKKNGSQVFIFAPGSERTNSYNPLDFVRPERGNRTTDIQNIASILVPENTESENSVWQATAQQVLAGAISYILESPFYRDRRNLGEINSFFNSGVDLQALMKHIKEKEPYLSKFTVESFNSYLSLSDRAAASALLDIQKAMRPFKNERVVAATNFTDMDLRSMKRRPITIYLAPNITDITLLRPLLTLFIQQVMDILTLEHDPNSVPVYFLLDEFRQLKRMDEIMTKLPYVAGYKIKLAFIIQDLKNLDEIYGETSRHSLLGNCGYQLILGANDQATADYASRALGKRTIRYSSESRTIEIMGLPRRTKVEQIRERDLMMSQEVRQMPENRMILLVEGQRPIFAEKLRFFNTQPFKAAEAYAQAHIPSVPDIEYLPSKPVPATTAEYENAGNVAPVAEPSAAVQTNIPEADPAQKEPEKQMPPTMALEPADVTAPATTPAKRTVNPAALTSKAKASPAARPKTPRKRNSSVSDDIARREEIEALHSLAAQKLREQVEKNSVGKNPTKRKNIMDVFAATVPDPETA